MSLVFVVVSPIVCSSLSYKHWSSEKGCVHTFEQHTSPSLQKVVSSQNVISPFVISTSDFGHREVVVATCINQNK